VNIIGRLPTYDAIEFASVCETPGENSDLAVTELSCTTLSLEEYRNLMKLVCLLFLLNVILISRRF